MALNEKVENHKKHLVSKVKALVFYVPSKEWDMCKWRQFKQTRL